MTPAATEFVGAVTFEALTGRPVHTGLFDPGRALDHIKLAREANAIVVAPATADFLARASTGQANDLLSACLLAATCPVLLVPCDERSDVGTSADAKQRGASARAWLRGDRP
jgi:phosphopantothenoylcysteine decarboxylase/phosphopantothenate--cysteine ligase